MGHFGGKYLVENLAEIVVFVYIIVFFCMSLSWSFSDFQIWSIAAPIYIHKMA